MKGANKLTKKEAPKESKESMAADHQVEKAQLKSEQEQEKA